jgi:hypothetical protein
LSVAPRLLLGLGTSASAALRSVCSEHARSKPQKHECQLPHSMPIWTQASSLVV